MSRPALFALLFALALLVVPFAPLFIERTMMRSYLMDGSESITYGWGLYSLYEFWEHSRVAIEAQQPGRWRAVNLGLAALYAFLIAAGGLHLLDARGRMRQR